MAGLPHTGEEYAGRYRVGRQMGAHGMSATFEATDQAEDRKVALTVFRPPSRTLATLEQRLASEVSVLARATSPHLVAVLDQATYEDTVYLAATHYPDGDLGTWLEKNGAPERRVALKLVAQLCEGLAEAHALGIIHRDVKPRHVLLSRWAGQRTAHLRAYAIGLDAGTGPVATAGLPRTGTLIGSPAYMAPERHFGQVADIRADIYSVGCVLWTALTATPPYSGTDFEVINAHINAPVPMLTTGEAADDRINRLLALAMAKDAAQRIGSASILREQVEAVLATLPAAPEVVAETPAEAPSEGAPVAAEPATD